jgi:hypothetical protein
MEYVSIAQSREGWTPDPPASALKGRALEEALAAAELPSTGTADEKRAALAALEAEVAPQPAPKPAPISSATPAATKGGQSASSTESD